MGALGDGPSDTGIDRHVGNVADLVRSAARVAPSRAAVIAGARELSWAVLDGLVDALAAGLRAHGLPAGARVAIMQGNTPEFVVSYFGVLRAGLVAVPLNTGSTVPEVAHVLAESGSRLLLADGPCQQVATAGAASTGTEVRAVAGQPWTDLLATGSARGAAPNPPAGDTLAVLLFTSGTGGRPKGVMLTHAALLADVTALRALDDPPAVRPDDVVLLVLPLFHVYGLNAVLGLAASAAATCVLLDRFDPAESLGEIRRCGVTSVPGAPPMYVAWSGQHDVRAALAGVRLLTCGGAALPVSVYHRFRAQSGHEVWEGYGVTEAAPVVATTLVSGRPKPGAVGRPLPGLEVRLVDDGVDVDEGDPGEVWVRGPTLFAGYWPDGAAGPDAEGWFNTGDVGYLDGEGDLHLVARRREVILVSGFTVYPREVEAVIGELPDVAACAVVGAPHAYTGETVRALVVPLPAASLSSQAVLAHCEARLARFKCPTIVEIVDVLPHSATGKVVRGRLRDVHGS